MLEARFRMELPQDLWVRDVSTSFPASTFRLLTGARIDGGALELGEIRGPSSDAAAEGVRTHPDVVAYEELHAGERRSIAKYETVDQQLYDFLGDSSLPPEFPVVVEDGAMEFDVTTTREQFEALGAGLDDSDYEYELLSVVEDPDSESLLTTRQREVLTVALREGYFEVPRDCRLADVADAVGVDTSTASETLRRGSGRILEWFLVGGDPR